MATPTHIDIDDIDFDLPEDEVDPTKTPVDPVDPPNTEDPPSKKDEGDPPSKEEEDDEEKEDDPPSKEGKEDKEGVGEGDEGEGEEDDEPTIIDGLKARLGFDFGEVEFEDSYDGVIELMSQAADKKAELLIDKFVEENPEAANFWKYLRSGGDPKKYVEVMSPEFDYLEVQEIAEDDAPLQERLVKDALRASGETEEAISEAIEEYKAAGILQGEAKRALSRLQREQKETQEKLVEHQEEQAKELKRQEDEYYEGLNKQIKKASDFKGLPITEKDKDSFFSFIRPNEEGVSEYAKKVSQLNTDELLAIQYLVYRGFDLGKLIDIKSATKQAKSLSEQLKKNSSTKTPSGTQRERQSSVVSVEDLDLGLPVGG